MNVAEIVLASIAALLACAGAAYMYGETADMRSAERINAVLAETAANAEKAGPKLAEMSRADIQKLGIVPEAVLDRRAQKSHKDGASEIAWKDWNAKTGRGGVELATAGVREDGKGYFRVYLTGVSAGICARVFADQMRESRWTSLGVSNEAKMARGDAEANPGTLRRQCADPAYDGSMLFEIELGSIAVVYLESGGSPLPVDGRTVQTAGAKPAAAAGGKSWTRDTTAFLEPAAGGNVSTLTPGAADLNISGRALSGIAGAGQAVKNSATGDGADVRTGNVSGENAHNTENVMTNGTSGRNRMAVSSDAETPLHISNYAVLGSNYNGFQNTNADYTSDVYINSRNANDKIEDFDGITSWFFKDITNSNLEMQFNEYIDIAPGAKLKQNYTAAAGVLPSNLHNSTVDIDSELYMKSLGSSNISFEATSNGGGTGGSFEGSVLNLTGRARVDTTGASASDTNYVYVGASSYITGVLTDGEMYGLGEGWYAGGDGSDTLYVSGIQVFANGRGNKFEDGMRFTAEARGYLDGGGGKDKIAGRAMHIIDDGNFTGGEMNALAEFWFDGGAGDDETDDVLGIWDFRPPTMEGGLLNVSLDLHFEGGEGNDSLGSGWAGSSYGIESFAPGIMSGGTVRAEAKAVMDGGEGSDSVTAPVAIGTFGPRLFTKGDVSAFSEAILAGGAGSDSVYGGTSIGSVSSAAVPATDDATLFGYSANLLFGDQRIPMAEILGDAGIGLDENDAAGIVNAVFGLDHDGLAGLEGELYAWELESDGVDRIYAKNANAWTMSRNVLIGSGGGDTLSGGSGAGSENLFFGGSGADTITGGSQAFNYAFGGTGNDTMNGGGNGAENVFFGGTGNDKMQGGGNARNEFYGEEGADTLIGGSSAKRTESWTYDVDSELGGIPQLLAYNAARTCYKSSGESSSCTKTSEGHFVLDYYDSTAQNGTLETFNELHGGDGDDSLTGGSYTSAPLVQNRHVVLDYDCSVSVTAAMTSVGTETCTGTWSEIYKPRLDYPGIRNELYGGDGHDVLTGGTNAANFLKAGDDGAMLTGGSKTLVDSYSTSAVERRCEVDFTSSKNFSYYVPPQSWWLDLPADAVCTETRKSWTIDASGLDIWNALFGGNGQDTLKAGNGPQHNYLFGGGGSDTLTGGGATSYGQPYGDLLAGDAADSLAAALEGMLDVSFSPEDEFSDMLEAVQEMDAADLSRLQAGLEDAETAADGNDIVTGSAAGDVLLAGGGTDNFLYGMNGDDIILGGSGRDVIFGGSAQGSEGGADTIFAGSGEDIVWYDAADAIDCGSQVDILLNASREDLGRTTGCEYGLSVYEPEEQTGPVVSLSSTTRIYDPFSPQNGSGSDILLGADADDLASLSGYAASLELADSRIEGATKIENLSTAAQIAEQLGVMVSDDGTVWITDPSQWSPTDGGSWRNDAANLILHSREEVHIFDASSLAATCSDAELGSASALWQYAGWDKLWDIGIALTEDKSAVTLSADWKLKNDGTGYVNCARRLVLSNAEGMPVYKQQL